MDCRFHLVAGSCGIESRYNNVLPHQPGAVTYLFLHIPTWDIFPEFCLDFPRNFLSSPAKYFSLSP